MIPDILAWEISPGRFISVSTDWGFGILPVVCVFQGSYFEVFIIYLLRLDLAV